MIAALFVETGGAYSGDRRIDPWDLARDARTYPGPWPVVAHPPCERWGRFASGGPSHPGTRTPGEDGGCFSAALAAVRMWGGVLEHPAGSRAWAEFGLLKPGRAGWSAADFLGGWTCEIEQGAYGHKARKRTWLYAAGVDLPSMKWGPADGDFTRPDMEAKDRARGRRPSRQGVIGRMSHRQRAATPAEFRELLIAIAATAVTHE